MTHTTPTATFALPLRVRYVECDMQGRVFNAARFGEFRALGRGKVLLVGLADEKLQRIEPRPDAWGQDGGMPQEERLAPQIGQ